MEHENGEFDLSKFLGRDSRDKSELKKRTLTLVATDGEWEIFMRDLPKDLRDRFRLLEELFFASTYVQSY